MNDRETKTPFEFRDTDTLLLSFTFSLFSQYCFTQKCQSKKILRFHRRWSARSALTPSSLPLRQHLLQLTLLFFTLPRRRRLLLRRLSSHLPNSSTSLSLLPNPFPMVHFWVSSKTLPSNSKTVSLLFLSIFFVKLWVYIINNSFFSFVNVFFLFVCSSFELGWPFSSLVRLKSVQVPMGIGRLLWEQGIGKCV